MEVSKTQQLYGDTVELAFNDARHKYVVRGEGLNSRPKKFGKPVGQNAVVPSVTTVTGHLDKSRPLMYWAVGQTVDYVDNNWIPGRAYDELEKKSLLNGAKKAWQTTLEDAQDIGNFVHKWLEEYILWRTNNGSKPALPENKRLRRAITQFLKWEKGIRKSEGIEWIFAERMIYSINLHFAGTLDALAYIGERLYVIDFKTSKDVYPDHHFQTAAYRYAVEEEFGETGVGRIIIHINKKSGQVHPYDLEKTSEWRYKQDFAAFAGLRKVTRRIKGL